MRPTCVDKQSYVTRHFLYIGYHALSWLWGQLNPAGRPIPGLSVCTIWPDGNIQPVSTPSN